MMLALAATPFQNCASTFMSDASSAGVTVKGCIPYLPTWSTTAGCRMAAAAAAPIFAAGWLVPAALCVCLILLGIILWIWQTIKQLLWG